MINYIISYIIITNLKPLAAPGVQHDRKLCPFYHNPRDRRRPPGTYSADPCDEPLSWAARGGLEAIHQVVPGWKCWDSPQKPGIHRKKPSKTQGMSCSGINLC